MSASVAYVGIAPCGHVRAASVFEQDDVESTAEAAKDAKGWKRSGLNVELWSDIDRVRASFGSCAECDPRRRIARVPVAQQLELFL